MNATERNAVKIVAKTAPWLAPVPSAYFVARSAITNLDVHIVVAIVMAAIIETLGLATVHTTLWAYDWNLSKRKSDPEAPTWVPIILVAVYLVATLGLVVVLEVWPQASTYAPAIFPLLAVVGTVNLAFISRQELREAEVARGKAEARRKRAERKADKSEMSDISVGNGRKRYGNWQEFMADHPAMLEMTGEEIGRLAGTSGRTGRNWKRQARASNGRH